MHRLRGFDYKRPFFYMVTLKRLPSWLSLRKVPRRGKRELDSRKEFGIILAESENDNRRT